MVVFALDKGTEESGRRAVVHFNKDLNVCEAIGDVEVLRLQRAAWRLQS